MCDAVSAAATLTTQNSPYISQSPDGVPVFHAPTSRADAEVRPYIACPISRIVDTRDTAEGMRGHPGA